jgi:hypothetical protein
MPILIKKIGLVTVRLKEIEVLNWPSDTVIVMEEIESKSSITAEPDNNPEAVSKVAHAGMPEILKTKLSPSASFADGVKFSASPTLIVDVLPEIVGGEFCTTVASELPPPHELITSNALPTKPRILNIPISPPIDERELPKPFTTVKQEYSL